MKFERGVDPKEGIGIGRKANAFQITEVRAVVVIPAIWTEKNHWNYIDPSRKKDFVITEEYLEGLLYYIEEGDLKGAKDYIKELGIKIHKREVQKAIEHNGKKGSVKFHISKAFLLGALLESERLSDGDHEHINLDNIISGLDGRDIIYKGKIYTPYSKVHQV